MLLVEKVKFENSNPWWNLLSRNTMMESCLDSSGRWVMVGRGHKDRARSSEGINLELVGNVLGARVRCQIGINIDRVRGGIQADRLIYGRGISAIGLEIRVGKTGYDLEGFHARKGCDESSSVGPVHDDIRVHESPVLIEGRVQ